VNGHAVYFVRYQIGPKQRRLTLGRAVRGNLKEMRLLASAVLAKARLGIDVVGEKEKAKREAAQTVTLGELVLVYLKRRRGKLREKSYAEVERYLTKTWRSLHASPIKDIDRQSIVCIIVAGGPPYLDQLGLDENADAARVGGARLDAHGRIGLDVARLDRPGKHRAERRARPIGRDLVLKTIVIVPLADAALELLRRIERIEGRRHLFGVGPDGFNSYDRRKRDLDKRIAAARGGEPLSHWVLHDVRRSFSRNFWKRDLPSRTSQAIVNHIGASKAGDDGRYYKAQYLSERREALEQWADYIIARSASALLCWLNRVPAVRNQGNLYNQPIAERGVIKMAAGAAPRCMQ
jgi:hypothetical protein